MNRSLRRRPPRLERGLDEDEIAGVPREDLLPAALGRPVHDLRPAAQHHGDLARRVARLVHEPRILARRDQALMEAAQDVAFAVGLFAFASTAEKDVDPGHALSSA